MSSGLPESSIPLASAVLSPETGAVLYSAGNYAALGFAGAFTQLPYTGPPADVYQQLAYYVYAFSNPAQPLSLQCQGIYNYSDTGYALLGAVVETISQQTFGLDYGDYLQTYILGPMGISPPAADAAPNTPMAGIGRTLAIEAYPTEVSYYAIDPSGPRHGREDTGTSVFPNPSATALDQVVPAVELPQPYGGTYFVESHFGEGGLAANPLALVTFFGNLYAAYTNANTSGPLTPATVQAMVSIGAGGNGVQVVSNLDLETCTYTLGDNWWGLGWEVAPPAPSSGFTTGNWSKNGGLPGTASLLYQYPDGTAWAMVLNEHTDDSVGTAQGRLFEQTLKGYMDEALQWAASHDSPPPSGPVATITVSAGSQQTTDINTTFALPLQVEVTAADGSPIAGVTVTFTTPPDGASGLFAIPGGTPSAAAMAVTDSNGRAAAPPLQANAVSGRYFVAATAEGFTPAFFTLINAALTTQTTLSSSASPSAAGQAVTLTATVTPPTGDSGTPTGSVTFVQGTTVLATQPLQNGVAMLEGLTLFATSTIRAVYDGDDTLPPSTSPVLTQVVNPFTDLRAVAAAAGGDPEVHVLDPRTGAVRMRLLAFDPAFRGGVRHATGDLTGDGVADLVVAAGPGGGPHVKVFDGRTLVPLAGPLGSFFAYDAAFAGGVFVAVGDVNGDGLGDLITGADAGGGPHVKAFSGRDGALLHSFMAFDLAFRGGVRVGAGDVSSDGFADIIVGAGPGGGPHVKVFDGRTGALRASFFAYDSAFGGGVHVAAARTEGGARHQVLTGAGAGGGPHVKVFNGLTGAEVRSFFAYEPEERAGVRVEGHDVTGDGRDEIVTSTLGREMRAFDGLTVERLNAAFGGQ